MSKSFKFSNDVVGTFIKFKAKIIDQNKFNSNID